MWRDTESLTGLTEGKKTPSSMYEFHSWVCVRKGYDNGREIGELKVDLRSLIFNLEDFFGGVFSFHVHYYWKLRIGF